MHNAYNKIDICNASTSSNYLTLCYVGIALSCPNFRSLVQNFSPDQIFPDEASISRWARKYPKRDAQSGGLPTECFD